MQLNSIEKLVEKRSPNMPGCEILDLDNEEETMIDLDEENTKLAIPRSKMGSNDMRNTPTKIGSIQYVQHRDKSSTIEI
jgi:hypothetical protein